MLSNVMTVVVALPTSTMLQPDKSNCQSVLLKSSIHSSFLALDEVPVPAQATSFITTGCQFIGASICAQSLKTPAVLEAWPRK